MSLEAPSDPNARLRAGRSALWVLTLVNLLNYVDRYIFSALAPELSRDLGLSDSQVGLLGSAFVIAYTIGAPLFGWCGDRLARPKVMAAGVALWSLATAASGAARGFIGQLSTRLAVGVGEAAYSVIAPSLLADYFPKRARGRVFAIYSAALPVGTALGYILGEQLAKFFGWRSAFFAVGFPGLACAVLLLRMRDAIRGQVEDAPASSAPPADGQGTPAKVTAHFVASLRELVDNGGFVAVVLGYAAYTFVLGGMAYWMPTYITRYFQVENGITVFGLITVAGGFAGTFIGGWWADRIERGSGNGFLKVCVWSIVIASPLFALALHAERFVVFIALFFLLEVALFLCMSPLDAVVVGYVHPAMRATAMAANIFLIHALGDGVSRWLIGSLSDASDLRGAILSCFPALVVAGVIWFIGVIFFWQPMAWPKGAVRFPKFQAHRGWWKTTGLQENTSEALRAAHATGFEMAEIDVQLSADGQVVLFHDEDLKRIASDPRRVREVTAAELREKTGAPRLEEVLQDPLITQALNIELKTPAVFDSALEREVARVIHETGSARRVLFSSFNPFSLRRLSRFAPQVPRALLVSEERWPGNVFWLRWMLTGLWARPHLLHLDQKMIDERRLRRWTERGLAVVVWTVNDRERARQLLKMGVAGIISDVLAESDA